MTHKEAHKMVEKLGWAKFNELRLKENFCCRGCKYYDNYHILCVYRNEVMSQEALCMKYERKE